MSPMSHPTRVRGLKLCRRFGKTKWRLVAPHTGAWIETKTLYMRKRFFVVAPHTGAWIET